MPIECVYIHRRIIRGDIISTQDVKIIDSNIIADLIEALDTDQLAGPVIINPDTPVDTIVMYNEHRECDQLIQVYGQAILFDGQDYYTLKRQTYPVTISHIMRGVPVDRVSNRLRMKKYFGSSPND